MATKQKRGGHNKNGKRIQNGWLKWGGSVTAKIVFPRGALMQGAPVLELLTIVTAINLDKIKIMKKT